MGGAERAVLEFHGQTANIANMLLEQFRELYGEELTKGEMDDSQKAIDERYYSCIYPFPAFHFMLAHWQIKIEEVKFVHVVVMKRVSLNYFQAT